MYLFENYIQAQSMPLPGAAVLIDELQSAGFKKLEIQKAFAWFAGLEKISELNVYNRTIPANKLRYYSSKERNKLRLVGLDLLLYLERINVIDALAREKIIDRAMAIEHERIEIEQLKWIVLMVLFHDLDRHEGADPDLEWVESLLFAELGSETIH